MDNEDLINNQELLKEIEFWKNKLDETQKELYELAFFKIFTKFELFLTEAFIGYSIGKESINNYRPKRLLNFQDKQQLDGLLKCSQSYINYLDKIEKTSKHIFDEKDCSILELYKDSNFNDSFNKMKYIRNYIAHESEEAKNKYQKNVLDSFNISQFINPSYFLIKIYKKRSISYYSFFINKIEDYSKIVLNDIQ